MRYIVIMLTALLILLVSFVAWLGLTESGLSFVISQVEEAVPELSIQKTAGRFYDGAEFGQISYQIDDSNHLSITHLTLSWQAMHLFSGRLEIDRLLVGDVVITQSSVTDVEPTVIDLPNINIPIAILLKTLSIDSITLVDQAQYRNQLISGLNLQVKLWGNKLDISSLLIKHSDNVSIELSGKIALRDQYPAGLVYQWMLIDPTLGPITAEGNITGNLAELKIEQQLLNPLQSSQVIKLSDVLGTLIWDAEIHIPRFVIADFIEGQPGTLSNLNFKGSGDLTGANLVIDSQFKQINIPELSLHSETSTSDFENWLTDTNLTTIEGMKLFIAGEINHVLTSPTIVLNGQWQQLAWPLVEANKTIRSEQGDFSIIGDIDHYNISITGNLEAKQQPFSWQLEAKGNERQIDLKKLQLNGFQGKTTLTGRFNWESEPKYQLTLNWQDIIIPKALSPLNLSTEVGELTLSGSTTLFTATSAAKFSVDNTLATITLNGTATDKGFNKLAVYTKTTNGNIAFDGQAFWLDKFKLSGRVNLSNINPVVFSPMWSGDVSGDWTMTVDNVGGDRADIRLDGLDVNGLLRQKPFHLKGDLSYLQQQLNISKLKLLAGRTEISVNGNANLTDSLSLNWLFSSPDLADLYPDLTGQVHAEGRLAGTVATPVIIASLSGQKIAYSDLFAINKVTGDITIDTQSHGRVKGNVFMNDLNIDSVKGIETAFNITGSRQQHQLSFNMQNQDINASGQLSGVLTDKGWQGQLAKLKLEQAHVGQWNLTKHGRINIASGRGQIEEHCLHSINGDLCLQAKYSPEGNWQSKGHFSKIPMTVFHVLSKALKPINGALYGHFEIAGKGQYPTSGQGEIKLDNAKLQLTSFDQNQQQSIPLQTAEFNYQLTNKNTMAKVLIVPDFEGLSAVTGEINLPNIKMVIDDPDKALLRGYFKTKVDDLSVFDALNAQYENLKGYLNIDLSLAGSVKKPAFTGQVIMNKASVDIPSLGLALSEMNATAKGSIDKGILFSYHTKSGEGHLTADGKFINKDEHWQLNANLKGRDLELVNLPEAFVIASHDLKISVNDNGANVTGSVTVPEAALAPLQLNMPITPSKDVVILTNTPVLKEKLFPTMLDVNIALGEKVKVIADGFTGRLTGNLLVSGDVNKLLLGKGAILIKDGKYTAYGQKLTVDDGQILFSGGALDNPHLNMKAIRKTEDVTAGLRVQGPTDNPQITLFSSPSMPEEDILAHIITGHDMDDASMADAVKLAAASTELGIKGGVQIGDRIASTFGLDSIEIEGDGGEDTALQIGKYLSPKLYLGYGIGIFDPVTTVIIRYKLTEIWSLKAESGIESSVDILYTYEQ